MSLAPRLILTFIVLVLLAGLTGDLLEEGTLRHVAAIVATTSALLAAAAVLVRLPRSVRDVA